MAAGDSARLTFRICLGIGEAGLVSSCPCRGSMSKIHFSCLRGMYGTRAQWSDLTYPICRHPYDGPCAVDLGQIGLAIQERENGAELWKVARTLTNLGNA